MPSEYKVCDLGKTKVIHLTHPKALFLGRKCE